MRNRLSRTSIPSDPTHAFVSMGIYLFRTDVLREQLIADAKEGTKHDFGKNIIPRMIRRSTVSTPSNFRTRTRKT